MKFCIHAVDDMLNNFWYKTINKEVWSPAQSAVHDIKFSYLKLAITTNTESTYASANSAFICLESYLVHIRLGKKVAECMN